MLCLLTRRRQSIGLSQTRPRQRRNPAPIPIPTVAARVALRVLAISITLKKSSAVSPHLARYCMYQFQFKFPPAKDGACFKKRVWRF